MEKVRGCFCGNLGEDFICKFNFLCKLNIFYMALANIKDVWFAEKINTLLLSFCKTFMGGIKMKGMGGEEDRGNGREGREGKGKERKR